MDLKEIEKFVRAGESDILEFKKSTAQLRRAAETLCGMLNGNGGCVLIGVAPDGRILGQEISDKTMRDVAEILGRFEPPATILQNRHISTPFFTLLYHRYLTKQTTLLYFFG
jgi:ATP-dependent DNA helicase RecG